MKPKMNSAPKYTGRPCCGKPELSVMLYGDINGLEGEDLEIWLRETLKFSFEHVHKKPHVGYAHIHFLKHEYASDFFYDNKDVIFDGPTGNENIKIKESYYFGGSKRKVVYLKKPKIIITEEADDRTEAVTQERLPPVDPGYTMPYSQTLEEMASSYEADIEINTHFTGEEKTAVGEIVKEGGPSGSKVLDDGMYIGVAQKPTGFSIKSILNNESDNSSTSNKKRKFDLETDELCEEVYYRLLPAILKFSETIQNSRDYWEKSFTLKDKTEKEEYKVIANKEVIKAINILKKQKLTEILNDF